ncbi:hypothetical protein, partial [Pseudomonas helmanticensis]|uniref:hypothetical protein n=1 Tax=Pseudomonas helmanticensis TaxID=1471381 RepID=UPI00381FA12B
MKKLTWPERPVQGREALAKILKTLVVDTVNVVKEPPGFRCFSSVWRYCVAVIQHACLRLWEDPV